MSADVKTVDALGFETANHNNTTANLRKRTSTNGDQRRPPTTVRRPRCCCDFDCQLMSRQLLHFALKLLITIIRPQTSEHVRRPCRGHGVVVIVIASCCQNSCCTTLRKRTATLRRPRCCCDCDCQLLSKQLLHVAAPCFETANHHNMATSLRKRMATNGDQRPPYGSHAVTVIAIAT